MEQITKEQVLKSYENGNIFYMTIQGANEQPIDDFMSRDADDILRMLNRTEDPLLKLHEKNPSSLKWVNDYAVAKLIRALKVKLASIESTATVEVENNDDELKNAEQQIKTLKARLAEYENQVSHLNASITEYNESIDMMEKDNDTLSKKNNELMKTIDEIKHSNDEQKSLNEQLTKEKDELMNLVDKLKAQSNELSVRVKELEQSISDSNASYTLEVYVDPSDMNNCKVVRRDIEHKTTENKQAKHTTTTHQAPMHDNNINSNETLSIFNI